MLKKIDEKSSDQEDKIENIEAKKLNIRDYK